MEYEKGGVKYEIWNKLNYTLRTMKHQSKRTYAPQCSQQHNLQEPSTGSNLSAHQQMSGSKNYGTFTLWNSMQQRERRSLYPLQ